MDIWSDDDLDRLETRADYALGTEDDGRVLLIPPQTIKDLIAEFRRLRAELAGSRLSARTAVRLPGAALEAVGSALEQLYDGHGQHREPGDDGQSEEDDEGRVLRRDRASLAPDAPRDPRERSYHLG